MFKKQAAFMGLTLFLMPWSSLGESFQLKLDLDADDLSKACEQLNEDIHWHIESVESSLNLIPGSIHAQADLESYRLCVGKGSGAGEVCRTKTACFLNFQTRPDEVRLHEFELSPTTGRNAKERCQKELSAQLQVPNTIFAQVSSYKVFFGIDRCRVQGVYAFPQ